MVIACLLALPDHVMVVRMQSLARRMGQLAHRNHGLSTLASQAVAAAEHLGARLLVSAWDDGPRIRAACLALHIRYRAVPRGDTLN